MGIRKFVPILDATVNDYMKSVLQDIIAGKLHKEIGSMLIYTLLLKTWFLTRNHLVGEIDKVTAISIDKMNRK